MPEKNKEEAIAVLGKLDLTAPVTDRELDTYRIIASIIAERKAMALEQKQANPNSLPGHKIKPGSTTRSLKNTSIVAQKILSLVDHEENKLIPASDLIKASKFGIPALETLVKDAYGLTGSESKTKLAEILGDQLVLKKNKDSLIPS